MKIKSKPKKKKRLSLLERQQKLLEEKGFSKSQEKGSSRRNSAGHSAAFVKRQERRLLHEGRFNAAASSRRKVPLPLEEEIVDGEGEDDGTKSVASRTSLAPSMHPSVAYSMACSETTIGAGDDTGE